MVTGINIISILAPDLQMLLINISISKISWFFFCRHGASLAMNAKQGAVLFQVSWPCNNTSLGAYSAINYGNDVGKWKDLNIQQLLGRSFPWTCRRKHKLYQQMIMHNSVNFQAASKRRNKFGERRHGYPVIGSSKLQAPRVSGDACLFALSS